MKKLMISRKDLKNNLQIIKNRLYSLGKDDSGNFPQIIAVVKGNGMGLGLVEFSKFLVNNGIDFLAVANLYNEAADTDVSFGKNDVAKEVANKAFALENDQVSGKIKTDNGFYFIKCINHYDQDKTDANKSVILENRRKEAFDDVYQEFLTGLSSEFNEKVWQSVRVEVNDEVKTDKFFQVYEKYCNW